MISVLVMNLNNLRIAADVSKGLGALMVITRVGLGTVKIYPISGMVAEVVTVPAPAADGVIVRELLIITFPWIAMLYYILTVVVTGRG